MRRRARSSGRFRGGNFPSDLGVRPAGGFSKDHPGMTPVHWQQARAALRSDADAPLRPDIESWRG